MMETRQTRPSLWHQKCLNGARDLSAASLINQKSRHGQVGKVGARLLGAELRVPLVTRLGDQGLGRHRFAEQLQLMQGRASALPPFP